MNSAVSIRRLPQGSGEEEGEEGEEDGGADGDEEHLVSYSPLSATRSVSGVLTEGAPRRVPFWVQMRKWRPSGRRE